MYKAKDVATVRCNLKDTLLKGIIFSTANQKNISAENDLEVV
jgi:hypothetical protein